MPATGEPARRVKGPVPLLVFLLATAAWFHLASSPPLFAGPVVSFDLAHEIREGTNYVNALALSPDGQALVAASDDGHVRVWEVASAKFVRTLIGHKGAVYAVGVSPDARLIATGGFDETIRLWDLRTGVQRQVLTGHTGWINALAFGPGGRSLASASRDGSVRIWDIETGRTVTAIADFPSEVFTVAFSPDGRLIAADKGNSFSIRDAKTGEEVADGIAAQWGINTLVFSSEGEDLLSAGYDGKIWIWPIRGGEPRSIAVNGGPVISISASGDGALLAASCTGSRNVRVWETASWREVAVLEGVSYPVGSVSFSRDGRWLAAGGGDSPIRIWKRHE